MHVTEVVIYFTGATERQVSGEETLDKGVQKCPSIASTDHGVASGPAHDADVVQGPADGHIAVIGHHGEDTDFNPPKEVHGKKLHHAGSV